MSYLRLPLLVFVFFSTIALISGSSSPLHRENLRYTRNEPASESETDTDIVRLTDEVIPTAYELRLIPDLEKATFFGRVEISIRAKFTTSQITLHSRKLKISAIKVLNTDKSKTPIDNTHEKDEENDLLYINTAKPLNFGTDYTLTIEFEGEINENMEGFYRSTYIEENKEYRVAVTQFEPNHARSAFPCFDEPRFRAPFTIYIAASPTQLVVSNTKMQTQLSSDSVSGPNRVWFKFEQSPSMPTYLVSYMVSDFTFVTNTEGNIRVIARKGLVQKCYYALKQSTNILKQLEGYFGIPYKLKKLDVVALPDFLMGGMENWGMATFKERFVIADEATSSAQHRHIITQLISHEFTHQWFGNLVTPAWYNHLWLKEGFATYFETYATAAIEKDWNLDQLFVIELVQESMWQEVFTQRPMTTSIRKSSQLEEIYDIISYEKAGSIIRMFEHMVSPNTFRNALHNFLSEGDANYKGVVMEKQLLDAFNSEATRSTYSFPSRTSISDIMKTWTENIGYPLITVNRSYSTGAVTFTQAPYQATAADKLSNQKWIVPLTYTTKTQLQFTNTRPRSWSFADQPTELQETVPSTDWILVNLQNTGYYRVNYDAENWKLLIEQLQQDHEKIHVLNRAQLINDVYALAHDKHLTYQVAIKLTEYLSKETDMIPWYAAIKAFNVLRYKLEYTTGDGFFKTYLHNLIKTQYDKIGFEIKSTDSHLVKIVKPLFLILACELGIEDCIQKSLGEYKTNEADLTKIQPDTKRVAYCYALRHSEDAQSVFNNLWATYTKYEISFEKTQILTALACAQDEEIIKKVLSKMIDPTNKEIRKQDRKFFLQRLPTRGSSISAVIKFVDEKIATISELNDDGIALLKKLLKSLSYNVKTKDQIKQLNDLEIKFTSLDKGKYADFIMILESAQSMSEYAAIHNAQDIERISKEVTQSSDSKSETKTDTNTDNKDKPSEPKPTDSSNSGSTTSLPKLGWNLIAAGAVLCYTLGVFKV